MWYVWYYVWYVWYVYVCVYRVIHRPSDVRFTTDCLRPPRFGMKWGVTSSARTSATGVDGLFDVAELCVHKCEYMFSSTC